MHCDTGAQLTLPYPFLCVFGLIQNKIFTDQVILFTICLRPTNFQIYYITSTKFNTK